jgi:AcrR family transcriptional regulator
MFTKNVKPRKRGRPPGRSAQGEAARQKLFDVATQLIRQRGYEATTLREVAEQAGVSVGLSYRYYPSKRAIVLALYEELSVQYADRAAAMPDGKWRSRFTFALETSLEVLRPNRNTLQAFVPVMLGGSEEGLFAESTAFSRFRVQKVFEEAVGGSTDAPPTKLAEAVGRLLYLVHLGVIMWWLLDKTPQQRATDALVALLRQVLPSAALTLRLPPIRTFVLAADELFREALFGNVVSPPIDRQG